MDFFNETLFPATFFRTGLLYKDLIMATTVVKCSFEVTNEEVFPVADQLAIVENDIDTDFGHLDSDISLIKKGCDFAVMEMRWLDQMAQKRSAWSSKFHSMMFIIDC